ncbi:hypothetical protein B0H16DRAFT_1834590 [Mycena metata]|uniref:Uncharacterized protein n=1 Tax=Mycena metata TaxID=1033252 RepID=A0AAD7NB92_9AGAR|nr:hypothetical protein B0H16DRAFT_1834590 [Mycena metata]
MVDICLPPSSLEADTKKRILIPYRRTTDTRPGKGGGASTSDELTSEKSSGNPQFEAHSAVRDSVTRKTLNPGDVAGPAQALKPSRAGPGLGQAEPSLTQGLGGLKARASEMPGPPGLESPGLDIYGQERADGAKRSRHFGLGGFGSVKCRTLCASNLLTHRIAVVSNVQNNRKTPNFVVGILFFIFVYEKAWAQARAQGFRPCTQGSVSGLKNLRPEPAQAEPKPGHSGRAGPATSLVVSPSRAMCQLLRRSKLSLRGGLTGAMDA